ncbi:MAG: DUF2628 domain-containing protein [Roseibium sp.]|uniref:DUF2628 domain-containing protein n=1 Tax=Roseibium sp. TaxID=1936156 RepID=UPI0026376A59|nr:DUF2628 domain-containing protein [Roseibium sp.]MCV0424407.1 DUF2628 domain-containing protein [Roseibium sp.]
MSTYVVMAPPEFEDLAGDPRQIDRLAFVPDKFSFLAFLFSIVWLLVHRMWLVLLGYLAVTLVIEVLALSISAEAMGIVALLISLLFGLEAQALRRWSLERKGWRVIGIAEGVSRDDAELRFLHKEAGPAAPAEQATDQNQRPGRTPIVPRIGSEQVVGLTLGPETRQ